MRAGLCLIIPLLFGAVPLTAQDVEPESDGPICIAIARGWQGDGADVRAIETVPVPESYRRRFESTQACVRFWLIEENLIDWHLRFGSERSTMSALAYLEGDYLRGEPAPDRYLPELQRASRAAQRDLRGASAITQPAGLNYSVQWRFIAASPTIRRLRGLVDTREKYIILAREHLRAAEEYGSLALLDAAEGLLRPALAGGAFLAQLAQSVLNFDPDTWRTDELEMRAAVLRARLTRAPERVARAEAVIRSKERPHYAQLAELAFSGGEDFCDISDGAGDRETLEAACAADDDALQERVVNHLLAGAMLDLIARPEAAQSWNSRPALATRLLNLERLPDRSRCCRYSTVEDLLRLHLAMAESSRRQVAGTSPLPSGYDHSEAWSEGLNHLREAERLAPPFDAPARFRRIAEAWLGLWAQGPALFPPEAERPRPIDSPDRLRYASYLRAQLAALDAVATGSAPRLPDSAN